MGPRKLKLLIWGIIYSAITLSGFWVWRESGGRTIAIILLAAGILGLAFYLEKLLWRVNYQEYPSGMAAQKSSPAVFRGSYLKRRQQSAARRILDVQKALYSSEPLEYKEVDAAYFPNLDRDFYDRTRDWFESRGFRYVGDCENLSFSRLFPEKRTVIRRMISGDGTICGAIFHVRTKAHGFPKNIRVTELETELSDATFICTSNTLESARTLPVPGIDAARFLMATSADVLLQNHLDRVGRALQDRAGTSATRLESLKDSVEFQQRMHTIKARHKKAVGYVGLEDIEKVRGRTLNSFEKGVVHEIEKLKQSGI